jgi:hypothetical protein
MPSMRTQYLSSFLDLMFLLSESAMQEGEVEVEEVYGSKLANRGLCIRLDDQGRQPQI